jgi:mannose-P-dolichol utilization defect protein 1
MANIDELIKLASAGLGYAIVAGSGALKAPQVIKIVRSGSAEGVSLPSLLLESLSYAIGTSWGFSRGLEFKDYGEGVIIAVQLVLLVVLVAYYQRKLTSGLSLFVPIVALAAALSLRIVPVHVHEMLLSVTTLISIASRLPQIYTNYKRKSTGQLAFLTFFLAFGGSAARMLTTFINVPADKGKAMILGQYAVATLLNLAVMAQMYLYRKKITKKD